MPAISAIPAIACIAGASAQNILIIVPPSILPVCNLLKISVRAQGVWALKPRMRVFHQNKTPEIRKEIRGLLGAGGRTNQNSILIIPFVTEG
jgi:hypothetical protein